MYVRINRGVTEGKLTEEEVQVAEVFMAAMVEKLIINSHKGGWGGCNDRFLFGKLNEENSEFVEAYMNDLVPEMQMEGADIANILLMLSDSKRLGNRRKTDLINNIVVTEFSFT